MTNATGKNSVGRIKFLSNKKKPNKTAGMLNS